MFVWVSQVTPEEYAENLRQRLSLLGMGAKVLSPAEFKIAAAEIRAAVEEANTDQLRIKLATSNALVNQAKAEAYEDAAKIADAYANPEAIAIRIRARAKELK